LLLLLLLLLGLLRGRGWRQSRGRMQIDVVDQIGRISLASELVTGDRALALLREGPNLHRHRVLLRVEADPEGQSIGQAAVEGDVPARAGAEEVDRAGGQRPAPDDDDRGGGGQYPAEDAPAVARRWHRPPAAAAVRRVAHPFTGEARLLGRARDQRRALLLFLGARLPGPEGDRGDVVPATALVGGVDQPAHRASEALRVGEDLLDLVVGDHRGQPVAAEQEHVPVARREGHRVDAHARLWAQGAGDDRALRVFLRLLLGQPALPAQLFDQRVVLGETLELAVAQHVGAAVADVTERDLVVANHPC